MVVENAGSVNDSNQDLDLEGKSVILVGSTCAVGGDGAPDSELVLRTLGSPMVQWIVVPWKMDMKPTLWSIIIITTTIKCDPVNPSVRRLLLVRQW